MLDISADLCDAVADADVVCVTFDTPVDDDDCADVDYVVRQVATAFPYLKDGALVLSSSQLPVGTISRLERAFAQRADGRRVAFACSPENLRLGRAIEVFTKPDRVVVGVRAVEDQSRIEALLAPITDRVEWMSVESAEMSKHAINAFLAASVTFINEIATLCEHTGADAKEVERGLKTDTRIGPHAYVAPGAAFAGGTLARDVSFLRGLGAAAGLLTPLLNGIESSNRDHRSWTRRRLKDLLGSLQGRTVALWGLTYKPGTDTLRRSLSLELCRWLLDQDAHVRVHDPAARELPPDMTRVHRADSPESAAAGTDALVVATEWPEYRSVERNALARAMAGRLVLDPNGFLRATFGGDERFDYVSVGVVHARR
jgi:UDPglucose 6-dehydrogenase